MSQVALEILEIPVKSIKPSPYQPRLDFDLGDIRDSIKTYGIRDPLKVRKLGDNWELIDGERRLRIAIQEGMKTVPCIISEYSDEEADAISWRLNTERKQYSLEERAKHFRKHQKEDKLNDVAIGRIHGYSGRHINRLLAIFRLPDKYINHLWTGKFAYNKFAYLWEKGLINSEGETVVPDIINLLELSIEQIPDENEAVKRQLTERQFQNIVDDYLADSEKREIEEALKAAFKLENSKNIEAKARDKLGQPDVKPPETSEELEKAGKALIKEAKKRKTPEQKHKETVAAVLKSLLSGKANVPSKLEKAKELGLDTTEFEDRTEHIKSNVEIDPEGMKEAVNKLKKDIDKARKDREAEIKIEEKREKAREIFSSFPRLGEHEEGVDVNYYKSKLAEIKGYIEESPDKAAEALDKLINSLKTDRERKRIRKEEAEKARIEVTGELLKNKKFIRKAAEMAPIFAESPDEIFAPSPLETSKGIDEAVRNRLIETRQRLKEIMELPEVKDRGKKFMNWVSHQAILDVLGGAFCPVPGCESGWDNLQWKCHGLNVQEAYEIATKEYQESIRGGGKDQF